MDSPRDSGRPVDARSHSAGPQAQGSRAPAVGFVFWPFAPSSASYCILLGWRGPLPFRRIGPVCRSRGQIHPARPQSSLPPGRSTGWLGLSDGFLPGEARRRAGSRIASARHRSTIPGAKGQDDSCAMPSSPTPWGMPIQGKVAGVAITSDLDVMPCQAARCGPVGTRE